MAIVNAVSTVLHAIISGIIGVCSAIIRFISCGYCGRSKGVGGGGMKRSRRSRI